MKNPVTALRLLIVEDDPDQRELVRDVIDGYFGQNAAQCVDGRAAALALDLTSYDLILSDYNLPGCTGLELLTEIRTRCDTPVILVTGENDGKIAAEAVRQGAIDYIVKVGEYLFTIPLVVEKNLVTARLTRENNQLREELQRSLKQTEEMAATDPLTGLYNRRHFGRVLGQLFAESQRTGNDLSCVMIDLDRYKQLNDTYGHQAGDDLLVVAAKTIGGNLRRMDVAARYGGDEFIVLLPHADTDEASAVATRIASQFKPASEQLLKGPCCVSMSIGVASVRRDGPSAPDDLVAAADAALYAAKQAGRDRVATCPKSSRITAA